MSNKFTKDHLAKSKTLDPISINRFYRLNSMCKFMGIKSNELKLTEKEIFEQLGYSDSTIKRYRDGIHMDSPYNGINYQKKTSKRKANASNNSKDLPKNEDLKATTNKKTKNIVLKSGDPSNIHMSGKELIEQAFS